MTKEKELPADQSPPSQRPPAQEASAESGRASFPIVGIGASAGGLQAYEEFFRDLPADCGMAFVLISHLDPHHASVLPELIGKKSRLEVLEVEDGMRVEPDRIYVMPPNREMTLFKGTLQLWEMSRSPGITLPIDTFLRHLAQDQGSMAIGIVLSGTGTDGTLGLRAVKGEGGFTLAQTPDSAKHGGMPKNAIDNGVVDEILPPARMGRRLLEYVSHKMANTKAVCPTPPHFPDNRLQKLLALLHSRAGHDFSQYKKSTLCRRIEKRMHVNRIENLDDYVRYARQSKREIHLLFKELLIGVTRFFRDPEAFALLGERFFPDLLRDRPADETLRLWVPGCSTGEEVYTLAMMVSECRTKLDLHFQVRLFGTDIDEEAVITARRGSYPESISADVSPERLARFFVRQGKGNRYKVKKEIRDQVIFAVQDLINDPPFRRIDLLSCRNLLIYFEPELQKKMLSILSYSLRPGGILFLGSSETVGPARDIFTPLHEKWKIFKKVPGSRQHYLGLPAAPPGAPPEPLPEEPVEKTVLAENDLDIRKLVECLLSQSGLPPSVVIDGEDNIVFVHGRTGRFLEPAEGEVSSNILEMARPGLKAPLAGAIREPAKRRKETVFDRIKVKDNGGHVLVNLRVKPLPAAWTGRAGLRLVVFEEVPPEHPDQKRKQSRSDGPEEGERVRELEDELQYTRETLQTTIEELETSNEELKSTNEELQSSNEELQSTNEELETSREELQALNEETNTVNAELQGRITELTAANDDIKNLMDATEIATIFLDRDLRIKRFTPPSTEIYPLSEEDEGRPINHFASNLDGVDVRSYAELVLGDLERRDVEIQDKAGHFYRMQVSAYRTVNNVIDGVVITFIDITEVKRAERNLSRLAAVVRDANDAITLLGPGGNILAWNRGAEKMYGYSEEEALRMNIADLTPADRREQVKDLLARLAGEGGEIDSFVTGRLCKDGEKITVWVSVSKIAEGGERNYSISTTERDLGKLTADASIRLTEGKGAQK